MLATISPSDRHYDESLSTLRYAERAKRIVTRATLNEGEAFAGSSSGAAASAATTASDRWGSRGLWARIVAL